MQVANADQEDFDQLHQQLLSEPASAQDSTTPQKDGENLNQTNMFV